MKHLSETQILALLLDPEVPADDPARRHLAACAACAARLAAEARFDLALSAAAERIGVAAPTLAAAPRVGVLRVSLSAAAVLVLAAGGWLLARRDGEAPPPPRPARVAAASPGAGLLMVSPETPCLIDPRSLGPGSDLHAPATMGRWASIEQTLVPY